MAEAGVAGACDPAVVIGWSVVSATLTWSFVRSRNYTVACNENVEPLMK